MSAYISKIYLRNFKSIIGPTEIELKPLSFFYGPNSAGKSSVYAAIDLVRQFCEAGEPTKALKHLVRNHDSEGLLSLGITASYNKFPFDSKLTQQDFESFSNNLAATCGDLISYFVVREEIKDLSQPTQPEYTTELNVSVRFDIALNGRQHPECPWSNLISSMAENIDALTLEAWKTDWVKDNIKKSAFPSDQSSWEAGDAYCVTELRVGTEVLFLMTWEFMAFNLDHEVFQVIDRMLSDDGLNFENLFSDFFYTHRIGNFIGAGPEHWFRAGFLDIGQNETQDGKPDKWSRLKDLIRFLVMMPLHICASAARAAVHLGPIRNIPDPRELTFMERDHEIYATAQSSKPQWNWYDGSAAWRQIARSVSGENLLDSVNEWLISPQRLGLRHRVVVAIYDTQEVTSGALPARGTSEVIESIPERLILVRLRDEALGVPVDVRDVGAGVPQIVPVLMAGLSAKSSFIEQPELHLHPRLQTEIADFFISAINTRSCRCVIETHSEHLALRTLRRIRETNSAHIRHRDFSLDENSVAFYYFNPVEGGTEITLLRVSPDGDFIDRWPSGFFSEREAEIFDEDD